MKKQLILLTLSALFLASCAGGESSGSSSSSAPITSSSEVTPAVTSEEAPIVTSEETPVITSEQAPVVTSEQAPVVTSEQAPVITSEERSAETSEELPVVTSEELPIVTSEELPVVTSEELPVEVSEEPISLSQDISTTTEEYLESSELASSVIETEFPYGKLEQFLAQFNLDDILIPTYYADNYEYYEGDSSEGQTQPHAIIASIFNTVEEADEVYDLYRMVVNGLDWTIHDSHSQEGYKGFSAIDPSNQINLLVSSTFDHAGKPCFVIIILPILNQDSSEEIVETSETSEEILASFPEKELKDYLATIGAVDVEVPSYEASNYGYEIVIDEVGDYIDIYSQFEIEEDALKVEGDYATTLASLGWYVDDSYYEDYGYFAVDKTWTVELNFYAYTAVDGTPYFDLLAYEHIEEEDSEEIDSSIEEGESTFPAEELLAYLSTLNAGDVEIPEYKASSYSHGIDEDEYGEYYYIESNLESLIEALSIEEDYKNTLDKLGWYIDDSQYDEYGYFAVDPSERIEVQFLADSTDKGGYFGLYIYEYIPEEDPEDIEENFDLAIPGEKSSLEITEATLLGVNDEVGIWNNNAFSFKVQQQGKSIVVGNTNQQYLSPIRIYSGQKVSIYSSIEIESISFIFDPKHSASSTNFAGITLDNEDASINGNVITLSEPSSLVSFTANSQIRIVSVEVTFAE